MNPTNFLRTPRRAGLGVALGLISVSASVQAAPAQRFPTSSGRIVYQMSKGGVPAMSGTITMLWAQNGQKFRQDSRLKINAGGQSMNVNTWTISDGKSVYVAMPKMPGMPASSATQVMRMKLPPDYLQKMAAGGGVMGAPSGAKISAGQVVGQGVILGKPCVVRVVSATTAEGTTRIKAWTWQNLPLRTEIDMKFKAAPNGRVATPPVHMTMVATQFSPNVQAAPSQFKLPAGSVVKDVQVPAQRR